MGGERGGGEGRAGRREECRGGWANVRIGVCLGLQNIYELTLRT